MIASLVFVPNTGVLTVVQNGGGPVQPGGNGLVVVESAFPIECPIRAPNPAPAAGRARAPMARFDPGSLMAYPSLVSIVTGPEMGATYPSGKVIDID
jgi:hypothetical protein